MSQPRKLVKVPADGMTSTPQYVVTIIVNVGEEGLHPGGGLAHRYLIQITGMVVVVVQSQQHSFVCFGQPMSVFVALEEKNGTLLEIFENF